MRQEAAREAGHSGAEGEDDNRREGVLLAQARVQGRDDAEDEREVLDGEVVEEREAGHAERGGVARGGVESDRGVAVRAGGEEGGEDAGEDLREGGGVEPGGRGEEGAAQDGGAGEAEEVREALWD